jgi:hypothetical protein
MFGAERKQHDNSKIERLDDSIEQRYTDVPFMRAGLQVFHFFAS